MLECQKLRATCTFADYLLFSHIKTFSFPEGFLIMFLDQLCTFPFVATYKMVAFIRIQHWI